MHQSLQCDWRRLSTTLQRDMWTWALSSVFIDLLQNTQEDYLEHFLLYYCSSLKCSISDQNQLCIELTTGASHCSESEFFIFCDLFIQRLKLQIQFVISSHSDDWTVGLSLPADREELRGSVCLHCSWLSFRKQICCSQHRLYLLSPILLNVSYPNKVVQPSWLWTSVDLMWGQRSGMCTDCKAL